MIPKSIDIGSAWKVLPSGIHEATLKEIGKRFATNEKRQALFHGFQMGIEILHNAGCHSIFLDGSFITDKPFPGDFDVCWDPTGVARHNLDPVLLDFTDRRKRQKEKFGGEFFPSTACANGSSIFLDFFQVDKDTGYAKGIIKVRFRT